MTPAKHMVNISEIIQLKPLLLVGLNTDTDKLNSRVIAKHTETLANELDAIDNEGSEQIESTPSIRQAFSQ